MLSDTGNTGYEPTRRYANARERSTHRRMHHRSGYSWNNHSVLLAQAGRRVVVLEDGAVGGGETGRTTAHLSNALDDRYHVLERLHGREGARLAAASHGAAIDTIEAIVRQEGISCDFERLDGYLFLSPGDSSSILDAELEAAHRAGSPVSSVWAGSPWPTGIPDPACASLDKASFTHSPI